MGCEDKLEAASPRREHSTNDVVEERMRLREGAHAAHVGGTEGGDGGQNGGDDDHLASADEATKLAWC